MSGELVPDGYVPVSRHFAATRPATDADHDHDLRVEFDDCTYLFSEDVSERGEYRVVDGLRLTCVEDDAGDAVDHPSLGTTRLPTDLLRGLVGATYFYLDADAAVRQLDKRRVITDLVWHGSGDDATVMATVAPGDGVLAPIRGLLIDAAEDRVEFTEFRSRRS